MATAQDYLSGLQYGAPGGGVGVNADKMNPEFANRMAALIQAAEKATGDKVSIFEGYRDPARSAQLRADYKGVPVKYDGKTYQPTPGMKGKYQAAAPMVSEHNLGMAADIRAGKNPDKYPSGPAYDYMVKHASEYGLQNLGANDPAHFEIPPNEYKLAMAGTPLKPFKNYNPDGLVPPMNIPTGQTAVGTKLDTQPPVVPMPGRPAALNAPPPRLPANAIVPRLQADNTLSYGQKSGITPAAKLAAAQSSHQDFGLGALTDPRTAALLAPTKAPAVPTYQPGMTGRGLPTPTPVVQPGMLGRGLPPAAQAPVPMPGRPAALMAAPPAPVQAQPPQLPTQRPSAPVAPPQQQQLRLASGQMIAPGIYDQGDHSVMVSDAGDGTAKVERVRGPMSIPGVIDPLREANANTIAGGMIRKMLPGQLAGNASNFVPAVTDNVKSAAVGAAQNLGNSIGGMFGGLGSMFAPKPPSLPTFAQLQAIRSVPANSYYRPAPMPMSRPLSFFAQPAPQAPTAVPVVARSAAPSQSNGGGYANGRQNAINDTLRTLGFNV